MTRLPIVVAGGGHAGIEAAHAIARMGGRAILVTMDAGAIGRMSCNPAIGGLAKSHLVHEIDALGGIMGFAADSCTIQNKVLNTSKGRAVWSLRSQIDKIQYQKFVSQLILDCKNISVIEDEVVGFKTKNGAVSGALLRSGGAISCFSLVITAGTFLNGLMHIGANSYSAGRMGEKQSLGLTECLVSHGFKTMRLKTGTPPRAYKNSIDWSKLKPSMGSSKGERFSLNTKKPFSPLNVPCYLAHTNKKVADIVNKNLSLSAMFSGKISAIGPRYCPSIEDKMVRFADRSSHQLFLEPEWLGSNQIYINGFSTSLPKNIQLEALRSVVGCESIELLRPGYAIEYDCFPTAQLKASLESKNIKNLFLAGQLNGTSGYEEAAAQGLIAGINSTLSLYQKKPFILSRNEAYIGVLVDDLITKTINEPYRMFTSRAEYRLSIRPDNCYLRLSPKAEKLGLLSRGFIVKYRNFLGSVDKIIKLLESKRENIKKLNKVLFLDKALSSPSVQIEDFSTIKALIKKEPLEAVFSAETEIKYRGYVKIQQKRINQYIKMKSMKFPKKINFNQIKGLSSESREKLILVRPENIAQASKIDGVRDSDVAILSIYLKQFVSK